MLHQRAKNCPRSSSEVENSPIAVRIKSCMVQDSFYERFCRRTRIENGGTELEMRPPELPLAGDSGNGFLLQPPCDKGFEGCSVPANWTCGITYEFRMIDSKCRTEQNARIGVRPRYAVCRKAQCDCALRPLPRHFWSEIRPLGDR